MQKKYAIKLHNGDQVEVRVGPNEWVYGYVVGDPKIGPYNIYVSVRTDSHGYFPDVIHTDLK